MRAGIAISLVFWALIAHVVTGCAGAEIGGRFGIYRVDERQESSRTYDRKVGLRCIFSDCNKGEEAQGS